ncbi:MAG TPA: polyketide synthase, partial [Candidatus Deferrimicrobium sp.]|nr:polyketide synthase [Candidatus Deferrimicrobium sp.]
MIKNDQKNIETGLEIAIIGMSGKFPGAETLDRFWENLKNGVETISFFTCEELKEQGIDETLLNNPAYVKAYGVLTGKENFDAAFFGFSPKEAESMDPQIRLFMECSWEALEDAGYDSSSYKGAVGLYAGIADGFSWRAARMLKELRTGTGQTVHLLDTSLLLSTRVSHKLDLKGPSITLYTACSTSLVAVHQACRALLTGECDMALAGAVSAQPIDKTGYLYQEGMILSPDGHNRSFDAQAQGTIFGEGIGIVLLKRLKDALAAGDNIQCVIKASAVNNDGIGKSSYTAPGKKRIADVIRTALKLSRLAPGNISYVETHGTATALGDAIEMEALKDAFNNPKKAYCALGSVKSNIGHLDVAAGMAGLIKTVKIIQHRLIPASLYFETPNSKIDFIDSP